MKKLLICWVWIAIGFTASACVYRAPVQQGNALDSDTVAEIKVGMTRKQVQYLLGTPLVSQTFNLERWDYVFYRNEKGERVVDKRLSVHFGNDRVTRVER
ncbi:MAG: outer membrane protein assembly factor BamE [Thiotrichales bacterium]